MPVIIWIKSFKTWLTFSPPNDFWLAKFLVCFSFKSASILLKVCENVLWVSNSLDPRETPSYFESHPDPSCLTVTQHFHQLWMTLKIEADEKFSSLAADDNLFGGLRVKGNIAEDLNCAHCNLKFWRYRSIESAFTIIHGKDKLS